MDKLISVKGLVIRTTPIIPDMKEGRSLSSGILRALGVLTIDARSIFLLSSVQPQRPSRYRPRQDCRADEMPTESL
jgi:hypothetical protein